MTELRIGLVGLGQMGRNHLRVLSMMRGVQVAFIHDQATDQARALAAQYDIPAVEEVDPAIEGVDALVVCTPTSTHADYIERYAPAVKAMFVEKPLAHSLEAARAVEQAVREHGTLVQVGFIERYNPAVMALRQVLQDAERVISVDFTRTNKLSARITDVDVIMDLMIHDIDLALHLNGPVETVTAQGVVQHGLIEFASAQLTHVNGRFSRLQASRITEKKIRLIQATCGDRFVHCDLLRKEIVMHRQSVSREVGAGAYAISSLEEAVAIAQQEALLTELQAFVALVQAGGGNEVPDFQQGIDSLEVADAIKDRAMRGTA
jgi:predicted dehydrogenase